MKPSFLQKAVNFQLLKKPKEQTLWEAEGAGSAVPVLHGKHNIAHFIIKFEISFQILIDKILHFLTLSMELMISKYHTSNQQH